MVYYSKIALSTYLFRLITFNDVTNRNLEKAQISTKVLKMANKSNFIQVHGRWVAFRVKHFAIYKLYGKQFSCLKYSVFSWIFFLFSLIFSVTGSGDQPGQGQRFLRKLLNRHASVWHRWVKIQLQHRFLSRAEQHEKNFNIFDFPKTFESM